MLDSEWGREETAAMRQVMIFNREDGTAADRIKQSSFTWNFALSFTWRRVRRVVSLASVLMCRLMMMMRQTNEGTMLPSRV